MGLFGKALGGLVNKISQGIQGAKAIKDAYSAASPFIGKALSTASPLIGKALSAASPFIGTINPALGIAAQSGGSYLQNLKPGPVKDKLTEIIDDKSLPKTITVNSGVQQVVDHKRRMMQNAQLIKPRKRQTMRSVQKKSVKPKKRQKKRRS